MKCPRCSVNGRNGFLQFERDVYGSMVTCVNCGMSWNIEKPADYDPALEASMNRSDGHLYGPGAVRTRYRDPRKLREYRTRYEAKRA